MYFRGQTERVKIIVKTTQQFELMIIQLERRAAPCYNDKMARERKTNYF